MAAPACMSDDGNPAIFVGTFLQNGDAVALCEDCLPQFAVAIAAQMTGIEVEQLAGIVAHLAAGDVEDPAGAAAEVAAPVHTTATGAPSDEPPAPAPADSDDGDALSNYPHDPKRNGRGSRGSSARHTGTADAEAPPETSDSESGAPA